MKNSLIELMYRDAGNYKSYRTEIVVGEISVDDWQAIVATLDMGELFVAEQVGLVQPEPSAGLDPELDHGFTCLVDADAGPYYTDAAPTMNISAADLVARFKAVTAWNPTLGSNFTD